MKNCGKCGLPRAMYEICDGCTDKIEAQSIKTLSWLKDMLIQAECASYISKKDERINKQCRTFIINLDRETKQEIPNV